MKIGIGKKVKVVSLTDDTGDESYIGKEGIVIYHNSNGKTGNTIEDPLHVVHFEMDPDESFWFEELEEIN